MPRRPFRVGRSNTGLGLFATRPIRKRARIAEYKGRKLTTKEATRLETRGNLYLYELNSRWTIDGTPRSNIARYFNHSCNPNAEVYDVKHRVFIRTLRPVKPGEEITYDYQIGRDRADPPNVDDIFACRCGAHGCRGSMLWPPRRRRGLPQRATRRAGKSA